MSEKHPFQQQWLWAYSILGWLLGTLGPATFFLGNVIMIFAVNSLKGRSTKAIINDGLLFDLFLTGICSFFGAVWGFVVGLIPTFLWRKSRRLPVALSPVIGLVWAILTGGVGGIPVFIIGGVVGAIVAIPYGVCGFTAFAAGFESLARRRQLRLWHSTLLAFGITILVSLVFSTLFNLLMFQQQLQKR